MKTIRLMILSLTWIALCLPAHAADKDPNLVLIKARQGEMEIRSMGIGHTSWVPAQRPSMGVMLNP